MLKFICLLLLINNTLSVEKEAGALVLNDRTVFLEIDKYDYFLLEFMDNNCNHCKEFEESFEKLTSAFQKQSPKIYTGKINTAQNEQAAKKFNIETVPALLFFMKGKNPVHYAGKMDYKEILLFINYLISNKNENISENQVADYLANYKRVFIYVGQDKKTFSVFNSYSQNFIDANFVTCPSTSCVQKFNATNGDVVHFNDNGETLEKFSESKQKNDLGQFMNMNLLESVTHPNKILDNMVLVKKHAAIFLFTNSHILSKTYKNQLRIFKKAIKQYKVKFI